MGQPAAAVSHAECGIALYDRDRHASHSSLYGGHDPGACCRYHLAVNRWLLGYPDQALATIHEACRLAEELGHPMTTVITHWFLAWVHYQRGEREAAAEAAEQFRLLADSHGFKNWREAGIVLPHARATARLDRVALAELRQRLFDVHGVAWVHIFFLCVFAQLCADAGHPEEGFPALAAVGAASRDTLCGPEIYRIEGELLLRSADASASAAEECFRTAIELARRRTMKSLELRAATSLAGLWRRQGRSEDARRVLADIYGWFTDGLETRDLVAAKALLEELTAHTQ
jgi:tetratricopeptide (TPR) repeat protein